LNLCKVIELDDLENEIINNEYIKFKNTLLNDNNWTFLRIEVDPNNSKQKRISRILSNFWSSNANEIRFINKNNVIIRKSVINFNDNNCSVQIKPHDNY